MLLVTLKRVFSQLARLALIVNSIVVVGVLLVTKPDQDWISALTVRVMSVG